MCEELKRVTVSKIVTVIEVTIPGAPSQTDRAKMWNVASDNSALSLSVVVPTEYSVKGS
jgi:hypothetical protein